MTPGRGLDALVAEEVMGWRTFKKRWQQGIHSGLIEAWIGSDGIEVDGPLPAYSTDMAAAWEVVNKIKTLKKDLVLEFSTDSEYPHPEWAVSIKWFELCEGEEQQCGPFSFDGFEVPHAICLAALKAVGVEL